MALHTQTIILHLLIITVGTLLVPNVVCGTPLLSTSSSAALFGIRGGAFFGFGRKNNSGGGDGDDDPNNRRFPALSQEEIEETLNIPVFGLTDEAGNGVITSNGPGGNGDNIFHFFFSKHMADLALKQVSNANPSAPPLKVSAFHLGKCWFKLINKSGIQDYTLKKYGVENPTEITKRVHFHLVPNRKDLMGARILTGLSPGDVDSLKNAVDNQDQSKAISIVQNAANNENASFTGACNQIPVFTIAQMRVRRKDENGDGIGENLMPFHLSTKTMSDTWNEFVKQSPQYADAEATLQLIELHKMIEMMQNESDFDFRKIVFVLPIYDKDDIQKNDYDSDDDSDDDGGGGGDFGMKADNDANYDDMVIEPFVSMEVFANNGQSLVQLDC